MEACKNDELVENAIALFSSEDQNWWNELSDLEKNKTLEAIHSLKGGKYSNHLQVMESAWKMVGK